MTYDEEGWEVLDGTGTEVELQRLLHALVRAVKPQLIVETGCYHGFTTRELGMAAFNNGGGSRVVSCDVNPIYVQEARDRCFALPVDVRECSSADLPEVAQADLLFSDSVYTARLGEVGRAKPGALVIVHDTKACASEGIDLAGMVLGHGGILFDTYRGFGLLRKGAR